MKPVTALGSAIVGALAGIVGSLAVTSILARPNVWNGIIGIPAGDWLQAFATILGIALTVRGTMWLEDRKRSQERVNNQRLLREALFMMRSISTIAQQPLDAALPIDERRLLTAGHYEVLRTSRESVEYARQNFRVDNYNLWSALNALATHFTAGANMLRREENIVRGNVTEPMLAISRSELEQFAGGVAAPVDAALAAL